MSQFRRNILTVLVLCLLPVVSAGFEFRATSTDSLTAFLQRASAGDTILLAKGDYHTTLEIDVPIVLLGEGLPRIRGGYSGHVVRVTASNVIIDGLRVSEAGTRLAADLACILIEADSVTVRNCHVDQSLHGIYVKGGNYSEIHHNRIEGRLDLKQPDRGNGIHLWNSRHNRVSNNEILNTRDGIYFSFADSTEVDSNHIHHVRYGLHYMYSNENSFNGNVFEENVAGAALMYSQGIYFYHNVFARCRGFRAYGILFQSMDDCVAENNLVLDNSRGLFFNNSARNRIVGNDIVDNDLAVHMNGSCDGNLLTGNNFIGNLSSVLADRNQSLAVWAKDGRGNHWSDYRGYDLDGDGIGDIEHRIQNVFQILETDIPEIRFYLLSPAAEMLEVAERTLPILSLGSETDPAPVFKPISNNKVPWQRANVNSSGSSPGTALIFALFTLAPIIGLLQIGRRKGRH
jgi:nitrous oxidase accessory protein